MILVNLGCGRTYHRDWINLDFEPATPEVRRCDVTGRLPFADESVDVVYHSHLLEHLAPAEVTRFLAECRRILRRQGIMRVAVPDLEGIARAYLREVEAVRAGGDAALYEWTRLELFDQSARAAAGGVMLPFLRSLDPDQLAAVRTRAGHEIDNVLAATEPGRRRGALTPTKLVRRSRRVMAEWLVLVVGGGRLQASFREGVFRGGGEVHRVMYDQISLSRLLVENGFGAPRKCTAFESEIPNYPEYELDAVANIVRKPDSLFLEAIRR